MEKKTKILIVTSGVFAVPAVKGGSIETLVTNLLDVNEIKKKYEFFVGSCFDEAAYESSKKYHFSKFIYYKKNHKFNFAYKIWALIYYFMRFFHVDIPKFHYTWEVYQAIKKEKIDFVIIEEGDAWAHNFLMKKIGRDKMIYHSHSELNAERNFEKNYDYVVTCSKHIEELNFKNSQKYDMKKFVLLNCINENKFLKKTSTEQKIDLRKSLSIPNEDIVFLFVGRIAWDKGVLELIEAWEKSKLSNAKLLIVGSALLNHKTLTEYEKKVKEALNKSKNIISLGFIPQNDLYKYYQISNVFVAPSYREPAGLMNIEAMFSGLPIISTNQGGVMEYIINRRNGILISEYNAIDELVEVIREMYSNQELREKMTDNNLNDRFKFTTDKYYENFDRIIQSIQKNKIKK
ncbi:MAG: glycosyltransferase family 4 protein [Anaerorhabdus sp.]|uniref:glycosyltransferase family 4 protein n=1 Tax=Anaerorhabdus sp. TaxID=1872524 RepID=UPI002FCB910C